MKRYVKANGVWYDTLSQDKIYFELDEFLWFECKGYTYNVGKIEDEKD